MMKSNASHLESPHTATRKSCLSKRFRIKGLVLSWALTALGFTNALTATAADLPDAKIGIENAKQENLRMQMSVGNHHYTITLADNEAARAFSSMAPLSIDMTDLNSNEKYANLHHSLPKHAHTPGKISNGDIMLYGEKTLVIFYQTFQSSYAYTRIGHVNDPAGLAQALGIRDVRVEFYKQ